MMKVRRLTFVVVAAITVGIIFSVGADENYDKALFYSKLRVNKSSSSYELPFVPTGYIPTEKTVLRANFRATNLSDAIYLFSAFGDFGGGSPMFVWYVSSRTPNFKYVDKTVSTPGPSVSWSAWQGIDVELEVKDGNATLVRSSDGEVLQVLSSGVDEGTSFSCDKGDGLYLFSYVGWWSKAGSAPDIKYGGQFYVYSLSVSEKDGSGGETLVHRYVPCKVDGVVGLADSVTKTVIFHRNEWAEGDSPLTVDEGDLILPETRAALESSAVFYTGGTASFSSSFLIGGMEQEDATFVWDFGDATAFVTTTVTSISHAYEAAGTFTVSVTGGAGGLSAKKTLENCVTVAPDPSPLARKIGSYGKAVAFAVNDCEGVFEDFPVLVRLDEDSPKGFSYADFVDSTTGGELRFMGDDGKPLAHEIDTWNPDGTSLVWVKLPTCAKGEVFYAVYGGKPKVAVNPTDVWSSYIGVWHMGEAEGDCADATGHGLTARPVGATENSVGIAGPVGIARQSATTEAAGYLDVGSYGEIYSGPSRTMSGWVKMASDAYDQNIFSQKGYSTDSGWNLTVGGGRCWQGRFCRQRLLQSFRRVLLDSDFRR